MEKWGIMLLIITLIWSQLGVLVSEADSSLFQYTNNSDEQTIDITKYNGTDKILNIPAIIDGKEVTAIGLNAFVSKGLTSVTIPTSVTRIDSNAFADNQLTSVTFQGAVPTISSTAFGNQTVNGSLINNWFTDVELLSGWNGTVPQAMTIYSVTPPTTYTVEFSTNGGSSVASKKIVAGESLPAPNAPINGDYTFDGWYKDEALQTPWNFPTDTVTANTTLYAKWSHYQQILHKRTVSRSQLKPTYKIDKSS